MYADMWPRISICMLHGGPEKRELVGDFENGICKKKNS